MVHREVNRRLSVGELLVYLAGVAVVVNSWIVFAHAGTLSRGGLPVRNLALFVALFLTGWLLSVSLTFLAKGRQPVLRVVRRGLIQGLIFALVIFLLLPISV